jgi:hypothetical protein
VRRVRVLRLPRGFKPVLASAKLRVLSSTVVSSAPARGGLGQLIYSGGNQLAVGQIVAIGAGHATPDGFLGRVTGVRVQGQSTVVSTVPATLLQAVPTGGLDLSAVQASPARAASAAPRATVTCSGSAGMSIIHSVSFSTGLSLKGSWSLVYGLQSASVTADAKLNASLGAIAKAAGSCSLGSVPILTVPGPSVDGFVGPVPVVMTSDLKVDLDAGVSASSSLYTGISAGFSADAGVGWTRTHGFYPISGFSDHFSYTAPTVSANASASVSLVPRIDVLLYGVVGPQISLNAGLAFNANTGQSPWWTLTAPVDVSGQITIAPLGLTSPSLTIYKHTFPIAHATATVSVTNPGDQTSTVGSSVDLPITASDSDGGTLTYTGTGLPAGLTINSASGAITGTPTTAGSSTVTVTATDATGPSGSATFTWTINATRGVGGGGSG